MDAKRFLEKQVLGWSESEFQSRIIELARRLGWVHYHTFDSRRSPSGFPDLVLLHPRSGRMIFRELKTQKGRISSAQEEWLKNLNLCGADADVWRPADWVSEKIQTELRQS